MVTDPVSTIYNGIWRQLESDEYFRTTVREGNRIKYAGRADGPTHKDNPHTGGYPEARLYLSTMRAMTPASSSSNMTWFTFSLQVVTGDRKLEQVCHPMLWSVFRALAKWTEYLLPLEYSERRFVQSFRELTMNQSLDAVQFQRGIVSWVSTWSFEVGCVLPLQEE
jgi:hypothetical protein